MFEFVGVRIQFQARRNRETTVMTLFFTQYMVWTWMATWQKHHTSMPHQYSSPDSGYRFANRLRTWARELSRREFEDVPHHYTLCYTSLLSICAIQGPRDDAYNSNIRRMVVNSAMIEQITKPCAACRSRGDCLSFLLCAEHPCFQSRMSFMSISDARQMRSRNN